MAKQKKHTRRSKSGKVFSAGSMGPVAKRNFAGGLLTGAAATVLFGNDAVVPLGLVAGGALAAKVALRKKPKGSRDAKKAKRLRKEALNENAHSLGLASGALVFPLLAARPTKTFARVAGRFAGTAFRTVQKAGNAFTRGNTKVGDFKAAIKAAHSVVPIPKATHFLT